MMSIQFIFSIFILPLLNVQLLQREVIVVIKYRRRTTPSSTFRPCSASLSRSVMEIETKLSGNYLQHHIVCVQNELISFFIFKDYGFLQTLVRFLLIDPHGFNSQFLIFLVLMFTFISCGWRAILRRCYSYSFRSESLSYSWIMDIPNSLLNWTDRIMNCTNWKFKRWISTRPCGSPRTNSFASG
jgi:hypothetical protein